jgi:sugar lactone lactonase YvrE
VIDASGKLLGRIRFAEHCTNMAFGGPDAMDFYVTTYTSLYRTRVKVPGVAVW